MREILRSITPPSILTFCALQSPNGKSSFTTTEFLDERIFLKTDIIAHKCQHHQLFTHETSLSRKSGSDAS